jgi:Na+-translocating ferredoxin:NAD+ oxidoreductase subunit G
MTSGENGSGHARWMPVVALVLIAGLVAAAVIATNMGTRDRVARNEAAQTLKLLATVLPAGSYDNEPELDRIELRDEQLGSSLPLTAYRARKAAQPAAVILTVVAKQGYVGPIRLLVCITADGTIAGVRATEHQETAGIGDGIEVAKSPWILQFAGHSLERPPAPQWLVRRDSGEFDQLTGATITSRAVVAAIRDAQLYYLKHRDTVFSTASQS